MRRTFWVSITLGLLALLLLPLPGRSQTLTEKLNSARAQLEHNRARESDLSGEIGQLGDRISSLEDEIDGIQQQEASVQKRLDLKQAELHKLRVELKILRRRLAKLQERLRISQEALADRLVELYKTDEPDALTVVLESEGFNDLLERTTFLERVSQQDQGIVDRTRTLKAEVEREEARVEEVEARVQEIVEEIAAQRDQLVATRTRKQEIEGEVTAVRQGRKSTLDDVEAESAELAKHVADLEAEQAAVTGQVAGAAGTYDPGPVRQGSGSLIWPVNGAVTSPFGMRWGRLHAGVDIDSTSGTPIRAADAGRVILASPYGGYGNYVCIQHGGALSTCYAHLSSFAVSQGDSVGQGDIVGNVGCTGSCFGDHLHFETRVNGTPQDPMGYL
jgi:murein DD-endopeptidase MepM/ murein hydrolase activator NlpD